MAKIPAYTELTSPNQNDLLVIEDSVASATKKIKLGNLIGVQGVGYTAVGATPDTVTANGNRSYTCVFNSTDLSGFLSAGMRLRTTRTVSAPTQCTSLNGTTQYYSKSSPAGMTFNDDFVVSAWIKVSSYATGIIASRFNGTSGWQLYLSASGQLCLQGFNAGVGNTSYVVSYQSVPLSKWVHVAAQLDMSTFTATTTTSYIMIDGVDVSVSVARAGTNPTALIQAGDLEIGAANGAANFFPGKIAQVAIYNAKVTQATIKASISQGLSGSETSLISAYSFNNAITDLSANANNLTANGSAVATNADSPFGTQASGLISATLDYGIIQSVTFSTNTTVVVQVPEGCTIPTSGGVSAVSYSTQKAPYGFPAQRGKWQIKLGNRSTNAVAAGTSNVYANTNQTLTVPIGSWDARYWANHYTDVAAATSRVHAVTLGTSPTAETDSSWTTAQQIATVSNPAVFNSEHSQSGYLTLDAATPYYLLAKEAGSISNNLFYGFIEINNSYL